MHRISINNILHKRVTMKYYIFIINISLEHVILSCDHGTTVFQFFLLGGGKKKTKAKRRVLAKYEGENSLYCLIKRVYP